MWETTRSDEGATTSGLEKGKPRQERRAARIDEEQRAHAKEQLACALNQRQNALLLPPKTAIQPRLEDPNSPSSADARLG